MSVDGQTDIENASNPGANDTAKLTYIVARHHELAAQVKTLKMEQKELEDSAWEQCGYSGKAVRALSKESGFNAVEREKKRQLEEEIDKGRAALGLLATTPLGEAEMQRMREEQKTKANGHAAPKKRGRPKGSKNRVRAVPAESYPAS